MPMLLTSHPMHRFFINPFVLLDYLSHLASQCRDVQLTIPIAISQQKRCPRFPVSKMFHEIKTHKIQDLLLSLSHKKLKNIRISNYRCKIICSICLDTHYPYLGYIIGINSQSQNQKDLTRQPVNKLQSATI